MSAAVDAAAEVHARWHGRTYGVGEPDDVADRMVAKMMLAKAAEKVDAGSRRVLAAVVGQHAADQVDAAEAIAGKLAGLLRPMTDAMESGHVSWDAVESLVKNANRVLAEWDASHVGTVTG